jgi:Tfp pilus assembly protein FimT
MANVSERHSGFTTVELAMVVGMAVILAAFSTFGLQSFLRAYRVGADARAIASQLSLARMRASSAFTQARVHVDADARTYQIELDNKAPRGTFVLEGGTHALSAEVNLGYEGISTPAGEQTTIAQTPDVIFNSRGIPVDGTGTPTPNTAIYLTNGNGLQYAVTVSQTGRVTVWQWLQQSTNPPAWVAR